MDKYCVIVLDPAKDDLTEIIDYISIELDAPIAAENLMNAVDNVFSRLADFPTDYSRVPDDCLAAQGYRMIVIKNYIIFYTFNEDEKTVYIERILYGRRDWMWILRKERP